MMQVIDKFARDNGYAVIIDVSSQNTPVIYASAAVDVTKEIVELYDKNAAAAPAGAAPAAGAPAAGAPVSGSRPAVPVAPKPVAPKPGAAK
jgi:outer membrane protein